MVGVGLLLGSGPTTMHQVKTWSSITMLALMVLSWIGIFSLPGTVETAFELVPTYYLPEMLNLSMAGEVSMAV